ncbi:hypothetical protein HMPREF0204_12960 [Chryseobacterium gleum ATCC 35910]|nr:MULTISPECIES: ORF6N domain-containing protein [Bacteroidota]EFK33891.1 hypothetical protein HMPREF0204_12960 [Chryseobacterium gleum ATCC 35910]
MWFNSILYLLSYSIPIKQVMLDSGIATLYQVETKILNKAVKRYNSQYPLIEIEIFSDAHDRFLIIDETELYHIGASLKDLGKKWFAFSRMDIEVGTMLNILNNI